MTSRFLLPAVALVCVGQISAQDSIARDAELFEVPLPRWREGGTPPEEPGRSLEPHSVQLVGVGEKMAPTSGLIESPPEYTPCDGVIFRYGSWASVVTECVAKLTGDPTKDEKAYVVVSSAGQEAAAAAGFSAAGADMSKVVFVTFPTDSIWLRDYGPHFIWQSGATAIVDSHYYPSRPLDNFIPTLLAEDHFRVPVYPMGLYYSGGNFQPGPDRSGYTTTLVDQDNPGFGPGYVSELYNTYQGIDVLHVFPRLPGSVDGTGHIDMWMYLVDEDSVIISEFVPGSNPQAIQITDNAVPYMESLGFEVTRVPAWNAGSTHYTYTNAFRVNDRIFVPTYVSGNPNYADEDQESLDAWQAAAGPSVEIVPIDCYSIIPAAGAIHCIVMQVPRYDTSGPSAHVVSPDGGELLVAGTSHDVHWAATDDVDVTSVDLAYSTDGGLSYPYPITAGESNDGHFDWTIPATLAGDVRVQVVASDADANWSEAVSEEVLEIRIAPQTVYDFSVSAGVDRWAWGDRTNGWASVDGIRHPVTTEVASYSRLSASDATGGDGDPHRYVSPTPSGSQESTHLFEFTLVEDVSLLREVRLLWEGYGDDCTQVELYVWDDVQGNWGDGAGGFGENAYLDNFAGNRDATLVGHLGSDLERYVDAEGRLTFLVYAERSGDKTLHDYASVTTTSMTCQSDLGFGGPGSVALSVCGDDLTMDNSEALMSVAEAAAGAPVVLVAGFDQNPLPVGNGTLLPVPWVLFEVIGSTDGLGGYQLPLAGKAGVPTPVYLQAIVPNGPEYEFSNAVEAVFGL